EEPSRTVHEALGEQNCVRLYLGRARGGHYWGGSSLVDAVDIATVLQIPTMVIGLSMVAVGTSLPEFATFLVTIYRGNPGISIGNIIGSNIFNILFILGIDSLLCPIPVQVDISTLS
ncbi:MAG: hypothetical protein LUO93_05600, partial [Methanomicrobiales archaeon]|nr:hypothetical protein [Methanomicrobiales archaeon]